MTNITASFERALSESSKVLSVHRQILSATLIGLAPTAFLDWMYSALLNFLVSGIAEAVQKSQAIIRIYVCSVAIQVGETQGCTVADHVEALQRHTSSAIVDYVVASSNPVGADLCVCPGLGRAPWQTTNILRGTAR